MNIRQKQLTLLLFITSFIFVLTRCSIGNIFPLLVGEKIWFTLDPDKMEREILQKIPIGSPISKAKIIMERNGFQCLNIRNGEYYRFRDVQRDSSSPMEEVNTKRDHVDFVECVIERNSPVNERAWIVQIEQMKGKTTRLTVSVSGYTL